MNGWDRRVLIIAPHADDETLGCGGLIRSLARENKAPQLVVLTLGRTPPGSHDQSLGELCAAMSVLGITGENHVIFPGSQGRLDTVPMTDIVTALDEQIRRVQPTAVFFPYASHHQDHEVTYRAVLAALRPRPVTTAIQLVALYEYPYAASWPPPLLPGGKFHRALNPGDLEAKVRAFSKYESQHAWLDPAMVEAWARTRGREVGIDAAEAFWAVRGWL
jgi:LmbE family N-acetylglucosaminyl deacetylase